MKIKSIIIVVVIVFLLISNTSSSVALPSNTYTNNLNPIHKPNLEFSEGPEYYAQIIGIERFIYPDFNDLTHEEDKIDDDAIAMYDLLIKCSNQKEENIKLMLNEEATKDEIKKAIEEWLESRED